MNTLSYEEFVELARARLAQFPLIDQGNMKEWYNLVCTNEPHRLVWHLNRLANIGGSEIGVLVAKAMGLPQPFDVTPDDLYQAKMMITAPGAPEEAMAFGATREIETQAAFEVMAFGAGWRRATEIIEAFDVRANDSGLAGGLGYSPDDCFFDANGNIVLVDYKTPYRKMPDEEGMPIGYASQLHQGKLIIDREIKTKLGLDVDVAMLLVYGIHPESWIQGRTRELQLLPFDIDYNEQITQEIIRAEQTFFPSYVLKGVSPAEESKLKAEELAVEIRRMGDLRAQIEELQAVQNEIEKRVSQVIIASDEEVINQIKKIENLPLSIAIGKPKLLLGIPELKAFAKANNLDAAGVINESLGGFDQDLVTAKLKELSPQIDLDSLKIKVEKVNAEALSEWRLPDTAYSQPSVVFRAPSAKKSKDKAKTKDQETTETVERQPALEPG